MTPGLEYQGQSIHVGVGHWLDMHWTYVERWRDAKDLRDTTIENLKSRAETTNTREGTGRRQ